MATVQAPAAARRRHRDLLAFLREGSTREATLLTGIVSFLTVIGLVMSFSASFVDAAESGDPFGIFRRQLLWVALGIPAFVVASRLPLSWWRRAAWVLLPLSLLGLVVVLVPSIGLAEAGSRRWIGVGPIVVQPSELAKLATLLWLADVCTRKRDNGIELEHERGHLLLPALPLLALEATLVMLQPDLGTTLLLALIVVLVLWAEGIALRDLFALGAVGVALTAVAAVIEPYRFERILGWWRPEADPEGNGWQLLQSLYALGSGGWFGLGLGSSRGKWNFVPNPETDFIFAIIGEELGLIGAVTVVLCIGALVVVGTRVARRASGEFERVVALAITGWIGGQALVNIGAATGLLPITGVTLPLVSVGGSSLVSTLIALGILTGVARTVTDEP